MGEFGDKFRQAREKKELSFDDVSNVTKISSRMLRAIEEEHFDQLPGGVFNKGFIRAYAKHLGLNSDDAVSDYLVCLRQAQIDSHAGWDASPSNGRAATAPQKSPGAPVAKPDLKAQQPHPPEQIEELPDLHLPRAEQIRSAKKEYLSRQRSGPQWALIAVASLVVVLGMFFWMHHPRATNTAAKSTAPPAPAPVTASAATPTTTVPTTSAPSPSTAAPNPVAAPAQPQPTTSPSPAIADSQTTSVPPAPDPQKSTDPDDLPVARPKQASATAEPADSNQVKVEKKGDVTIRSFGATTPTPTEKSVSTLTLVVRASENSWISVTSDGQLLTQETLIAPAATSFHASRELVVRVGNAAGISFLWNGEEFPAQGAEAEAKTFIFDKEGMHASTPAQPPPQSQ